MNVVGITGNFVADPELKTTQNGDSVCSFTIAVKRPHTKDKTDFVDCVAWREKAEFISRNFTKGMKIEVSGYITTRIYGKEGAKRKASEIICDEINFGERKSVSASTPSGAASQNNDFAEIPENSDDLPF